MWTRYDRSPPVDMGSDSAQAAVVPPTPGEANAMTVTSHDPGGGTVTVAYDAACGATDHTVFYGNLSDLPAGAYGGSSCGHGTGGSATFSPGPGDVFWIVVASDGAVEGSYGRGSDGLERPESDATSGCDHPQDLGATCD